MKTEKKIKIAELKVIYRPGETNIVTSIHKGKCIYSGKTLQHYLDQGCILCTWDEALESIRPLEESKYVTKFIEITEEAYWYALEVLPPERWSRCYNAEFFRMSEYLTSNITQHFVHYKKRYFSAHKRTVATERQNLDEILKLFFE